MSHKKVFKKQNPSNTKYFVKSKFSEVLTNLNFQHFCIVQQPQIKGFSAQLVYYFAPYSLEYESKIFLSNETFSLPDVCQLRSRHIGKFVHVSEREKFFEQNCSEFAVECD